MRAGAIALAPTRAPGEAPGQSALYRRSVPDRAGAASAPVDGARDNAAHVAISFDMVQGDQQQQMLATDVRQPLMAARW